MIIPMVSMELDDEGKLDAPEPIRPMKPDFPWGLRITLTSDELDKLELDPKDAFVGGMVHGHFMARITSVSSNCEPCEDNHRVEMQIENLAIESEDAEDEDE